MLILTVEFNLCITFGNIVGYLTTFVLFVLIAAVCVSLCGYRLLASFEIFVLKVFFLLLCFCLRLSCVVNFPFTVFVMYGVVAVVVMIQGTVINYSHEYKTFSNIHSSF
jgi:hypothetical protein